MKKTRNRAICIPHTQVSTLSILSIRDSHCIALLTADCQTVPLGLQFSHPTLRLGTWTPQVLIFILSNSH